MISSSDRVAGKEPQYVHQLQYSFQKCIIVFPLCPFLQYRGYVFRWSVFLVNCDSGWQLNQTIGRCEICPRGFYRDKTQTFYCQMCPRHLITTGRGATTESDCRQGTLGLTDTSLAT